ncbi:MAG TPA: M1 family aminopeptidase [Gemmatimonadaceae bacterium]
MTLFIALVRWELRYYLRRISTWVYFIVFFAIAFLMMLAAGGAWDVVNLALGSGGKVMANSPYALASMVPVISLLGLSITAALAGNALYRDYDTGAYPLIYTTPVGKGTFLGSRFTGMVLVNLLVLLGIGLGAYAGTLTPWVHADKMAPFRVMSYVQPYLTLVLPNLLLTAAIFFALVSLTRQMLPNYVGGVLLLVGYLIAGSLLADIDNKQLAALLDPFGLRAYAHLTQYWSIAEKNTRIVPLAGLLLGNRALWLAVAAVIFGVAYARFHFSHLLGDTASATVQATAEPEVFATPLRFGALPAVTRHFDLSASWLQFRSEFTRSFWRIVRSRYFLAIVGGGLLYLIVAARAAGKLYGTPTWPVTYEVEEILGGTFSIFVVIVLTIYSGELVWSERDAHFDQIHDATPVSNAVVLWAKFAALSAVIGSMLFVAMLAGIVTQAAKGYFNFEIPLYVEALFGFRFIDLLLIAVLAFAVHVVVNQKYLGNFIIILLYLGLGLMSAFGIEHNLLQYGSDSGYTYSDMNGWGPFVGPFIWWKLYWGALAVLLLVGVDLFWVRGGETSGEHRMRLARQRFRGRVRGAALTAAACFVGFGAFIFYNTNVLNTYRTARAERRLRAERERLYKRFESAPQPRIVATRVRVDLYPSKHDAVARGEYVLLNRTKADIDSIHLAIAEDMQVRGLAFDRPASRVLADNAREYYIYRLARPLAPGDSTVMRFNLALVTRGFPNQITNTSVVGNGTFLENVMFMPRIGYDARNELSDDDARKKEHLPPRARMRSPSDPRTRANSYVSHDADWIRYDAVVSTDTDQLALTSGYLERQWTQNGRRYFHYTMDAPIVDLWAFQSARYAAARDRWRDSSGAEKVVDIEIDYHPAHRYNVVRMTQAVKKALDYYTAHFGPYQFHELRVVEFPRYAAFAQSLPNTIPFSEAIGFIARVEDRDDVDYPFYVTAHEVAHQWWAHQVVGADAQGSTMLSETMAQYSALMVMEKEFGPANMRKFLEYELNSYLIGRATEQKKELPLELVENQPYIHYNKGSLVMYALRDYIGEAAVNRAVRGFLEATRFRGPPYPTSLQLVDSLRAATPDSLKYLIHDLFEQITLYELKTDSVIAADAPAGSPGKYQVDLFVSARKLRADSLGKETEVPMRDWVDIGVFAKASATDTSVDSKIGVPLHLAKHQIVNGAQKVTVFVDRRPYRAGIDPLHKLIDRITMDNTEGVRDRIRSVRGQQPTARPAPADPAPRPTRARPAPARPR